MKKGCLLLVLGFLFLVFMGDCRAEQGRFENIPKLVVTGEASILKPADRMEVTLGVFTEGENSAEALKKNNQNMHQIIANLEALGLDKSDYQTGRFRVRPLYRKSEGGKEENRPEVIRYEVVNTIGIKTDKVDLASKIIRAALEGGANQIERVYFSLSSPQSYFEEAIKLAMRNALMDANSLASAAYVRLGRILLLSLDQWHERPIALTLNSAGMAVETETPIQAGNVEIRATVHVTFEIVP